MFMYYLANGLKTDLLEDNNQHFFISEVNIGSSPYQKKVISYSGDDIFCQLDFECVALYEILLNKIFPDTEKYYQLLPSTPIWISDAGHSSDFDISKEEFEKLLQGNNDEIIFRMLFYQDMSNLLGYLQSRIVGAKDQFILFYKNFCDCEPLSNDLGDVTVMLGEDTTTVFSLLTNSIINLYSILDLITKIVYQFEHIPTDFTSYPKLKSNMQNGNLQQIKRVSFPGTVFDRSHSTMKLIENLRHELIHNGYWEANPKIYFSFENGNLIEKWIFMPDESNGNLVAHHNRKRFFSQGAKINQKLPLNYLQIFFYAC